MLEAPLSVGTAAAAQLWSPRPLVPCAQGHGEHRLRSFTTSRRDPCSCGREGKQFAGTCQSGGGI